MPSDRAAKLLNDVRLADPERYELLRAVRDTVLGLDASISEEVKRAPRRSARRSRLDSTGINASGHLDEESQ